MRNEVEEEKEKEEEEEKEVEEREEGGFIRINTFCSFLTLS